ncbi:MAG: ACT domain-containing protein [Firmicutes bacterium]|nr:ACT domain-containing protein [Bacillota bacterium]
MQIKQLSVFVENKSGRLAEITETLAKANVDIRAISIADTSDFGILRLIVDRPEAAVEALRKENMTVSLTTVIAIGITDQPGEFAKAMRVLADASVGIEYMYAFISRDKNKAYVLLRVDDNNRAVECLQAAGIEILTAEEIHGM